MRWLHNMVLVSLVFLLLAACTPGAKSVDADKVLQITATTGMIADIAKNVGGQHVEATGLMGPGVDPHLYKASQGDIFKLDQADIILYNGLHLEGKMGEILEKISKVKPVVPVSEKISKKQLIKLDKGQHDPHVWFDVSLWMKATERVKEALIQADPAHKKDYEQQATLYMKKLTQLDQDVKRDLSMIPKEQRVLVTAHDAFHYFGQAYGMKVVGLQGISTASEYGLKDIHKIVDMLVEHKIKAVFVESSVPKRSIEAVVQGAKAKNHQVLIGGELYSDALGNKGTPEGTYIGMVRHNVKVITQALK